MGTTIDDDRLEAMLRGPNRVMFAGQQRNFLRMSLDSFERAWLQMTADIVDRGRLAKTATIDDLHAVFELRPADVDALLQAMALRVSVQVQVALWVVLSGGAVEAIEWRYRYGTTSPLTITVRLPGTTTTVTVTSDDPDDVQVLKMVQSLKDEDDGVTIVTGFAAVHLPFGNEPHALLPSTSI